MPGPPRLEGAPVGPIVDALHLLYVPLPTLEPREESGQDPAEPVRRPPPPPAPQEVALHEVARLYPVVRPVGAPQEFDARRVPVGLEDPEVRAKRRPRPQRA